MSGSHRALPYAPLSLALALFLATFAVNIQAPLYAAYAEVSGAGAGAVTVAFACYVAGLMPTLMLLGGLSDRVGRRLPIAMALGLGGLAAVLLGLFPGWLTLCFARFILGVGTGLVTTAGAAYMVEIMGEARARAAALVVTSATSLGFGAGALATGVSLGLQGPTYWPASFLALIVLAPLSIVTTLALPKVDSPRQVSLIRLPRFLPGTWPFGLAMTLAWSATGMTIAVVPLELASRGLHGWTGLVVFLSNFIGFLCQPLARRMASDNALKLGCLLIPSGFAMVTLGAAQGSLPLVLAGVGVTSAASYGFTYLGGLAEIAERSGLERARATAGYFVYAYVGFSLPVIASGFLADIAGLTSALAIYAAALAVGNLVLVVILSNRKS